MKLSICHSTHYSYSHPVSHGLQRLRLKPKTTQGQTVSEWRMDLDGAKLEAEYEDQHHNSTALITIEPGTSDITITCTAIVDTSDNAGIIGRHAGHMPIWAFLGQTRLTRPGPKLRQLASSVKTDDSSQLDMLHALSSQVLEEVRYEFGHTEVDTPAEDAIVAGRGVCQDHAHIFISASRLLGIPARYVSGYLMMDDRIEQEAGHGWAEAYLDGLGWVGFDVSNGICPDARYVRVATGCDYREAAPLTGISYGTGEAVLEVNLAVEQHLSEQ